MSNKPRTSDPRIFIVAANDELKDSQAEWEVVWDVRLTKAYSRHVVGLVVEVRDARASVGAKPVCRYENSWPNSSGSTFEAFLYQCYHRTARMVENWAIMDGGRAQHEQ